MFALSASGSRSASLGGMYHYVSSNEWESFHLHLCLRLFLGSCFEYQMKRRNPGDEAILWPSTPYPIQQIWLISGWKLKVEILDYRRQQQPQFHHGKRLTDTRAWPDGERHECFSANDQIRTTGPSLRDELFWILKITGIWGQINSLIYG
jgi:hypothetical protein